MSINLKKYKLSPEDQNILNLKYIDFTSDNPDLIDFLRLKPCLSWNLKYNIRNGKIWNNFQDSFYSELLNIATDWDCKDKRDYSFYADRKDLDDPLDTYIYAFDNAVKRFDINFLKKTFPNTNTIKRFIDRMIEQGYLKSKQWSFSGRHKKQERCIKTILEELLLSLPLESDYFETYSKNFSELTYKIHLNKKDALIKYINTVDEIAVKDLKRIPSKVINSDEVMRTLYSNIIKQKNKPHYQDRMLKFFLYTKKNKFWDAPKIPEIFSLIQNHSAYWGYSVNWNYFLKYTPHLKVFSSNSSKDHVFQAAYINHFINTSGRIVNLPIEVFDKYFDEEFWSIIHPKLMTNKHANALLDRSIKRGIIPDILQLALSIKKARE